MKHLVLEKKVLSENDRVAARLRERFAGHGVLCLNLISSPGAGKTLLLERTLERMPKGTRAAVLTGDIQTDNDARRLARSGYPVKQITTAGACHLDASMIERAIEQWPLEEIDYLFVENVGNLVCPASYDLGEHAKVVVLSVTEGEDKPLKYPATFYRAALMILNKVDLLPHLTLDAELAAGYAREVHPEIEVIRTSCVSGEGLAEWIGWIERKREEWVGTKEREMAR